MACQRQLIELQLPALNGVCRLLLLVDSTVQFELLASKPTVYAMCGATLIVSILNDQK